MDKRFLYVRVKEAKLFSDSGRESFGDMALKLGSFNFVIVMHPIAVCVCGEVDFSFLD